MGLRLCCGLVSDLCNQCASDFLTKADAEQALPALGNILYKEDFETAAKLRAIVAIGDIALVTEAAFQTYLPDTMGAFENAATQSLQVAKDDEQLNESLK